MVLLLCCGCTVIIVLIYALVKIIYFIKNLLFGSVSLVINEESMNSLGTVKDKLGDVYEASLPWLWTILVGLFHFFKFLAFVAINVSAIIYCYKCIETSRKNMNSVIKPKSAKVTKKKLIFQTYFMLLLQYYVILIIDLVILY